MRLPGIGRPGFCVLLATGFGLGLSPVASGTVGSLWGPAIVWAMQALPGLASQIAVVLLLVIVSVPLCQAGENYYGRKDDGRIVADEFLTFPICMLGLPFTPWVVALCFVSNRLMDILKPPPARQLQALQGGLGIVADDLMSSLYSLLVNHAIYWLVTTQLV